MVGQVGHIIHIFKKNANTVIKPHKKTIDVQVDIALSITSYCLGMPMV